MIATATDLAAQRIAAAQALIPIIAPRGGEIEENRRLPDDIVEALRAAGCFRLYRPRAFGGDELDPPSAMRVVEEIAYADASAGWIVQLANQAAWAFASLPPDGAAEIVGPDPDAIGAGAMMVTGQAVMVPGGYRVTGRWAFGSGIYHAAWMGGNCRVIDGDTPQLTAQGEPLTRLVLFPRAVTEVIDTWHTTGLRGSGSQDYAVHNLFVPERHTFAAGNATPAALGPLYQVQRLISVLRGAHALGVARRAVDELTQLAAAKTRLSERTTLHEHPRVQDVVGRTHARLNAAHRYLYGVVSDIWATVCAGTPVPEALRIEIRLANNHALDTALTAVDDMYRLGGGTAIYATSALDRCFRDIHTAAADVSVSPYVYEQAGRSFLGLKPQPGMF